MLEVKLRLLLRLLRGYPFEFARAVIYPRSHLGIPEMDEDSEVHKLVQVGQQPR